MGTTSMKLFSLILSSIIIISSAILCGQIILNSLANQKNKVDYAELNDIKYGLLNVDEWKEQLSEILTEEINNLYLSKTQEQDLKKQIETLLNTLMDQIDKQIKKENSGSVKGWVKQSFINIFISLEDIKKGIPEYADAIIKEMKSAKTEEQLKASLTERLKQYVDQTHSTQDTSEISRILRNTGSMDIEGARTKLAQTISVKNDLILKQTILMIILSVILFTFSGFSRQPLAPSRYIILVLSLLMLLLAGVTTPMIDIEARISHMSFVLMGHSIQFDNQILYFQTKSVLDIFWIIIKYEGIQMKAVGVLIITFSVFFPLLKILSSVPYYYNYHRARENPAIRFFILKSGKWSMADVMVVAIFMAYVGFNGIIASELGILKSAVPQAAISTTNGTSLQPGYYLFFTYTLLALLFSGYLTRNRQA
jgi:hypothetical protein